MLKRTYEEYKKLEEVYISKINELFNPNTFFVGEIVPKGTNIKIYFLENLYGDGPKEMMFYKQDGKLIYKNIINIPKPFLILGEILSELYDDFIKYSEFFYQRQKQLGGSKVINLKFRFIINSEGLYIFDNLDMFNVSWDSRFDVYDYSFQNFIKEKGGFDEFFKRIFVKIEDCPKWSQPILFEMR